MNRQLFADLYALFHRFSGLGYIIGAEVTNLVQQHSQSTEAWRWGLRVTPALGLVAVLLVLFALREPPRGHVEGGEHLRTTSYTSDIKYLLSK